MRLPARTLVPTLVPTLALLLMASSLPGQTGADVPGRNQTIAHTRVVTLIDELASNDWATRQRAEQYLLLTPNDELPYIESRLADASMSPEQRVRLMRAGSRIFRRLEHAAMGIRFVTTVAGAPAEILEPLPDFDSIRVIRPLDVVTQLDGMPIRNAADLRAAIIGSAPRALVSVQVVREDRLVNLSFRLGSYADLKPQRLNEEDLEAAWLWRVKRAAAKMNGGLGNEEGIGAGNGADDVLAMNAPIIAPFEPDVDLPVQPVSTNIWKTVHQFGAMVAVAAGQPLAMTGSSRYRPSAANLGRTGRRGGRNLRAGQVVRGGPRVAAQERSAAQIAQIEKQIAKNRRDISLLEQRIMAIDSSLKMPFKADDRARLAKMRVATAQDITRLTLDSARLSGFLNALRR